MAIVAGKFKIEKEIGRGATSVVYEVARKERLAHKVLLPQFVFNDKEDDDDEENKIDYSKIKEETVINEIKRNDYSIANYPYFPMQRKSEKTFDFDKFSIRNAKEICKIVQKFELPK